MRDSSFPFRLIDEIPFESCLGNLHPRPSEKEVVLKPPVPYLRQYDHLMPSHMERDMLGHIQWLGPR